MGREIDISDLKKYLGMVGHYPEFGKVKIVGVQEDDSCLIQIISENTGHSWRADEHGFLSRINSVWYRAQPEMHFLPISEIFKANESHNFWWLTTDEFSELKKTLVKKIYVKDLEELAELGKAKKAQESFKRGAGNQWRHQRHEAARAIFGVRKGRW